MRVKLWRTRYALQAQGSAGGNQDPTFNLIGRPRGPRMKCGWGCGAQLTGRNMRAHFTIRAKRPAGFDHVDCRGRKPEV
jgi:hypothetical protein